MRFRPWPLACALVLGLALPPERAEACFAPALKVPKPVKLKRGQLPRPPPDLLLGTTTVIVSAGDGYQTTTIVPEVRGDLRKFSLLIPVAGRVKKKDLKVLSGDVHRQLLEATRPKLEIVHDDSPCGAPVASPPEESYEEARAAPAAKAVNEKSAADYGVKVEAHVEVGEYDLAVLSARSAKGLGRWLRRYNYQVDANVEKVLGEYLARGMKILVARVRLKAVDKRRFTSLRPLQIRSRNAGQPMVPVAIAAAGGESRDLVVLALGEERMDLASHRMLELPTGVELPALVADDWDDAYQGFADNWLKKNGGRSAGLLEFSGPSPVMDVEPLGARPGSFLTRWRVRVAPRSADLVLAAAKTPGLYRSSFTTRVPWHDAPTCGAGRAYMRSLPRLFDDQAKTYSMLSGAPIARTRRALQARYPMAFEQWPDPPPVKKEFQVLESAAGDEGPLGSSWKIALGLLGLVVGLVVIGRVQRG